MKHISLKLALMAVVLAFAGTTFTACEDDIEITNGVENPWGNVDGKFGVVRSAAGAKMATTLTTRNGESATGHVYFELSKAAEQDTKVTFKVDAEALTAYNEANGTSYTAYEGVTLENNGEVIIPAGKRISDYVAVNVPADKGGDAFAITAVADNGVTVSSNNASYVYQVKSVNYPQHNKDIKNLCYIEVNNENPLNAGEYTLANGEPFFDIVSIFAANINLSSDGVPTITCNDQVTYVLHNADKIIRPLQEKGIKVHLSILGNHDDAGMRSLSEEGAKAFAKELKRYVDIYGLDGIDFDDEYSSYAEGKYKGSAQSGTGVVATTAECTPENYTKLLKECRALMPKGEVTFGIYWYTSSDHPLGAEVEDLVDYTVFGSYGSFREYSGQDIDNKLEAPYAITLIAENDGMPAPVPVNESHLNKVKNEGYGSFAFYNLKSSKLYTSTFNKVAQVLWNSTVEWTGNTYARTDLTPVKYTKPSFESWLGTWNVQSNTSLYYFMDGASQYWQWGDSQKFTVNITAGDEENTYYISGWENYDKSVKAITDQCPFVAYYNEDGTITIRSGAAVKAAEGIEGEYIMSAGTYSGRTWKANTAYEYILETTPNGAVQMYSNAAKRYGFGLFKVEGDNYTPVMDVTQYHAAGSYTFTR